MSILHDKMAEAVQALREQRLLLLKNHGDSQLSNITIRQLYTGMRDMPALVCDTSTVDPDKGLIIRGTPVAHLAAKLPEEVFFLLLTGTLPDPKELAALQADLKKRAGVPAYVWEVIDSMPDGTHPMTMLSTALMSMERDASFRSRFDKGMPRSEYWRPALDDSLKLIAVLPEIAAGVYRHCHKKGNRIAQDPTNDWAANFAHMLGSNDEKFYKYLRLNVVVQSDHEGGHASALTCHTVGSTLSSIYYALAAGFNALSGPLHGLASETCLNWVLGAIERYKDIPDDDFIRQYTWDTIDGGRVVPGYGHAVLRGQDPRYLAILAFGEKNCPRDPVFQTVMKMSRVIPAVLLEQGKVKNPWPNVDAINGSLFYHYGFKETSFYTVFFAVSLALGLSAQYVLNRVVGSPITRPRSVTTSWIEEQLGD